MKRALKIVGKVLAWIVVGVVVLLVVVLMALPPVAVRLVNAKAGDFVNAEVSLKDIDLNLLRGYVEIEGLRVGQPEGFEGGDLLNLPHAHVRVKVGSLMHPPITISDVRVEGLSAMVIKDTNGVMNVQKLARTPSQPAEEPEEAGPAGQPPAVALTRLIVNNLVVRYVDHSVGDDPLDVGVSNLVLTVTNILFDPADPGDQVLPGRVELTAKLTQGAAPNAHLGAIARLGVLSTNVPAVNAGVRIAGLELKGYDPVLPAGIGPGISAVLGGSCLDVSADVSMAPDVRNIEAALITKGARMPLPVGGSLSDIFSNLSGLIAARLGGQVTSMAGNVGSAGVEVAGTAVKSAGAVAKGAGKIVGNVGGGLFKMVKGAARGDLSEMGEGLKEGTVGSVKEAVSTVTNATMTAVNGVGEAANTGLGKTSADEWRANSPTRWQTEWDATVKAVDAMPYPSPGKPAPAPEAPAPEAPAPEAPEPEAAVPDAAQPGESEPVSE